EGGDLNDAEGVAHCAPPEWMVALCWSRRLSRGQIGEVNEKDICSGGWNAGGAILPGRGGSEGGENPSSEAESTQEPTDRTRAPAAAVVREGASALRCQLEADLHAAAGENLDRFR